MRVPPPSSTSSIPFRLSQDPSNKVLRLALFKLAAPFAGQAEPLDADLLMFLNISSFLPNFETVNVLRNNILRYFDDVLVIFW